jgi:hypothetical protein
LLRGLSWWQRLPRDFIDLHNLVLVQIKFDGSETLLLIGITCEMFPDLVILDLFWDDIESTIYGAV